MHSGSEDDEEDEIELTGHCQPDDDDDDDEKDDSLPSETNDALAGHLI